MGLFNKKNGYEAAAMELEEAQQRRRERSHTNAAAPAPSASAPKPPSAASPAPAKKEVSVPQVEAPKLNYGIEDVIQLMRDLPDNKKEMVILIVQKTLVSAKIDIKTILEKAARKIEGLQSKNDKLRSEIRELEEMIIQKKSDVDRLRRDMEETQSVRQSFEAVYLRGSRALEGSVREEDTVLNRPGHNLEQHSS
ncbi:MAG TPA: hypothetical protein VE954_38300 [Oligoflexus sp.]|uniref:hypothetical protein n=1 Tax=Oligoflexus sp. TaxID=1971216 RepID=UPI002D292BC7|nr:hypothetical protein [Oligoflexus sp.]HYX38992.1 hypothetical protein [Oligoflexus sp.]